MPKPVFLIVSSFIVYSLSAYGLLHCLNFDLPRWLESTIVIIASPLQCLFLPWINLLSDWGLTQGQWVRTPDFLGVIMVVFIYSLLIAVLAGAAGRLYQWMRSIP